VEQTGPDTSSAAFPVGSGPTCAEQQVGRTGATTDIDAVATLMVRAILPRVCDGQLRGDAATAELGG
jgi:hypothetical protein